MQASEDGSLAFLISKVRTQPQVYTAYSKTAPLRDRAQSAELEAAVLSLKVHSLSASRQLPLDTHIATLACLINFTDFEALPAYFHTVVESGGHGWY